jgi:hypothetical protein
LSEDIFSELKMIELVSKINWKSRSGVAGLNVS